MLRAALLANANVTTVEAAYWYGRNLGFPFQLADDILDDTCIGKDLGKLAGANLELRRATVPSLPIRLEADDVAVGTSWAQV